MPADQHMMAVYWFCAEFMRISLFLLFSLQVVRRRAVPREVGPPPGGPTLVHTQIPVVFFTQSGVPGEVTDEMATSQGPVAVCTQAMEHIGQLNLYTCSRWQSLTMPGRLCLVCMYSAPSPNVLSIPTDETCIDCGDV